MFTFQDPYALARKREQERLAQLRGGMDDAASGITGAISQMQALSDKKDKEKAASAAAAKEEQRYQAGLVFKRNDDQRAQNADARAAAEAAAKIAAKAAADRAAGIGPSGLMGEGSGAPAGQYATSRRPEAEALVLKTAADKAAAAEREGARKADIEERETVVKERVKVPRGPREKTPEDIAMAARRAKLLDLQINQLEGGGQSAMLKEKSRGNASKLLDMVESGGAAFEKDTTLPSGGRVMGPVRDALTGIVPGAMSEGARSEARGAEEAYNAMIFSVLGRTDAPADQETRRLAPLRFNSNDTPTERKTKIALGRAMLGDAGQQAQAAAPAPKPQVGTMVKVTNGNRVMVIPRSDVDEAAADGFHEVP